MSRHTVSAPSIEAIHALVAGAMTRGDGRVSAEELAVALAENEPARYRQAESRELTDEQYAASFEQRFGYSAGEAPSPSGEDEEYALAFSHRFGFEAAL